MQIIYITIFDKYWQKIKFCR